MPRFTNKNSILDRKFQSASPSEKNGSKMNINKRTHQKVVVWKHTDRFFSLIYCNGAENEFNLPMLIIGKEFSPSLVEITNIKKYRYRKISFVFRYINPNHIKTGIIVWVSPIWIPDIFIVHAERVITEISLFSTNKFRTRFKWLLIRSLKPWTIVFPSRIIIQCNLHLTGWKF